MTLRIARKKHFVHFGIGIAFHPDTLWITGLFTVGETVTVRIDGNQLRAPGDIEFRQKVGFNGQTESVAGIAAKGAHVGIQTTVLSSVGDLCWPVRSPSTCDATVSAVGARANAQERMRFKNRSPALDQFCTELNRTVKTGLLRPY